jgi:hypothetical protein
MISNPILPQSIPDPESSKVNRRQPRPPKQPLHSFSEQHTDPNEQMAPKTELVRTGHNHSAEEEE